MKESQRAYFLGDLNVDALLPIDSFPEVGGDSRSERLVMEVGGSATNTALQAASLGLSASLLASIGNDLFGNFIQQALGGTSLELDHLRVAQGQTTGMMFIPVTPEGQRTLFGQRGANRFYRIEDLPPSLGDAAALHLSGYALLEEPQAKAALKAFQMATDSGLFIAMDTAYGPPLLKPQVFKPLLDQLNLLIAGERELKSLVQRDTLQEAIDQLLRQGVETIALKRGGKGSRLYQQGRKVDIPALDTDVVDTTGAGDSYSGALLSGLLANLPLESAGLLATACATHIVSVWGAGRQAARPAEARAKLLDAREHLNNELADACQAALDFLSLRQADREAS